MYAKSEWEIFMDEVLGVKNRITYGVTLVPLGVCYLYYLSSYIKAFRRNLTAHEISPLLPLVIYGHNHLKFACPTTIVFVVVFMGLSKLIDDDPIGGALVCLLLLYMFAIIYQVLIALISIHRFFNNRRPIELRKELTSADVTKLYWCVFIIVTTKEVGTAFVMNGIFKFGVWHLNVLHIYFFGCYIFYQILLFIATALQFSMKSVPATSHSENNIVNHTKILGVTKFVLFIITGISYVTGIQTIVALSMFCSIDLSLVPVVIEITEIRATPNVIQQNNNGPGESV
ncbi:hypothetical protein CAEBREN_07202 [Caenorhabditis brenneri]|uniref:Serpentine Receptor, class Z n=1 Tax=Caenorhabditis brenneri TaxID=135651 RepID=G0M9X1_CAEBE|nr:hypothetical protein CAEBREN_07202 [Caenorhabditis brenneri]